MKLEKSWRRRLWTDFGVLLRRYFTPKADGAFTALWFHVVPLDEHTTRVFNHAVIVQPMHPALKVHACASWIHACPDMYAQVGVGEHRLRLIKLLMHTCLSGTTVCVKTSLHARPDDCVYATQCDNCLSNRSTEVSKAPGVNPHALGSLKQHAACVADWVPERACGGWAHRRWRRRARAGLTTCC